MADHYEPSPEEIAELTAEIRAEWDEATHRQRACVRLEPEPWTVPLVAVRITAADLGE